MSLNVSSWSIKKPIAALVFFAVVTLLGYISFYALPITRFPNIDLPIISVTISQSGAAPAELETQVTRKVEDAIAGIAGVRHITSKITDGSSVTTTEFRLEVNSDRALNDVKDAVAKIRSDLPGAIDEPIISRVDIVGLPIVTYAVAAPTKSLEEISWFVDDVVIRRLQAIRGVAGVARKGGVTREIAVDLDPDRLAALGLTAGAVSRQIAATNVDLAGGRGEIGAGEEAIRTLAQAKSLDDFGATMIALPAAQAAPAQATAPRFVRLSDLGTIDDSFEEPRSFASFNNSPVVSFAVSRAKGASDAVVAEEIAKTVKALGAQYPDFSFRLIDSYVDYTLGNYHSAMETLVEGACLSVLVVFLFLRDWRATLISAVALPLSIFPSFWVMQALGFSLNLVSLLAITLATGILVDDAIVEIENIMRHIHMGKSPWRAAIEAADEIGLAVIAISFTIIAVFVPVSFMDGIAGQYFRQFGLTVAISVMFSLLVARLITPMLAAYFLKGAPLAAQGQERHHGPQDGFLMRLYLRLVRLSVKHRLLTLGAGLCAFALSLWSTQLLPSGFLPPEDVARAILAVELPPGARLKDTQALAATLTKTISALPEVKSVFVDGGSLPGALAGGNDIRKATLIINFTHKSQRAVTQKQLEAKISAMVAEVPDMRFWFVKDDGQRGVAVIVAGSDDAILAHVAGRLQSGMRHIPILANPVSTAALDRPEIVVKPKLDLAAHLGITTQAISDAVRIATIGDVNAALAKYKVDKRLIPIRVRLRTVARQSLDVLRTLQIATVDGSTVPLASVADVGFGAGPASIDRYDRTRRVAVEADLNGTDALGLALQKIYALPAAQNLPDGVALKQTGDAEIMGEVFASFSAAIGAGVLMVYGVLVLLFSSFILPVTILFSLPLSIGGVILALLISGKAISMPVVIGILMLMGIVTKNAIMLVDFAVEEMHRGKPRLEALVEAGHKRARPIIMTTLAMGAGMFPSALALGDGGEFRAPMAIGVIGGLIVSTLLSLVFVPAVFTLMDDCGRLLYALFGRFVGHAEKDAVLPAPALRQV